MRSPQYYRSNMRHRMASRRLLFPADFQLTHKSSSSKSQQKGPQNVYDAWLASRELPAQPGHYLVPGAPRPLTMENARLALFITKASTLDFFKVLFELNPLRTTLMMSLNVVRSLFPAFRGYSQALIVDELQSLIASESFTWSRLVYLVSTEVIRRVIEGCLDSFAASNENIVMGSARFYIEYKQMEQRVRLDVPTLADPGVRALLQESELFARSFTGSGFGILSPLEFIHIISLLTEIFSHIILIISLTRGVSHFGILVLSIFSTMLPMILSWFTCQRQETETVGGLKEARAADRQERLRSLAYSDLHRPEIALFGLGDWILKSWTSARKIVLASEQPYYARNTSILDQFNLNELVSAVQNIPLLLLFQTSSASLGSLTVYRTSIQSLLYACRNLVSTSKMVFQGIFLMSAFTASTKLKPRLNPRHDDVVPYISQTGGVSITAKNLSYTYPGSSEPALRNINFTLEPGETLAIVGYNGSGKSTLAKLLLRIVDYDRGSLLVNGVDIRRYNPAEYHSHLSAVFQGFSKFSTTVKENVGLGNVDKITYKPAIETAVHLAEADTLVKSLPTGLKTMLETPGYESLSYPGMMMQEDTTQRHGLSGGEWQRIALARAFMRANEPGIDMFLFDEPTSALDAHAQNQIFDTVAKISRSPSGERTKTVIFITHRLSTARRADKVAMMENGTITEFGTHDELIRKNGTYASLYRASI
ncbi:P-loop containing nucleoside triphosphate hydrolase protein [Crepidotus variabilis]|uniref:P-loop containing nucleoside triphosphate hydrolase protein n=1 Tax=Crepidotus variabilis TaxID=179855 RepID=A0A9P6EUA9_9AGAR|nr:P-loop containing nucleoside triphosphate hydrolase protein [Crepidotus variabilis]